MSVVLLLLWALGGAALVAGVVWWSRSRKQTIDTSRSRQSPTPVGPTRAPSAARASSAESGSGVWVGEAAPVRVEVVVSADGVPRVDVRGRISKTSVPLRAREVAGLSASGWRRLLATFDSRCRYCARPLEGQGKRDHRQPLARGGRNEAANIVPACAQCNSLKSLASEQEYVEWMRTLTGNGGWMPVEAVRLLAEWALDAEQREERSETLLKEVFASRRSHQPYPKPVRAVLMDPPGLHQYSRDAEHWFEDGLKVAGVTFHRDALASLLGSRARWGGWGYLQPEPHNTNDPRAVAVVAGGRRIGYLPQGSSRTIPASSTSSWQQGNLPVVRVAVSSYTHTTARVHVLGGSLVHSF